MPQQNLKSGYQKYFIAIIPPAPIYDEALALKNCFKEKYHSKGSLNSPPHITLHMPFLWKEKDEEALVNSLKNFFTGTAAFDIGLPGFGSFPPRVIFISVEENTLLAEFQKKLQRFCKTELNLFNAQYKDLPFHPHLTLAFRDLKKPMFAAAWHEFKSKSLSATFTLAEIALLKHDGKLWQVHHVFHF